MFRKLVCFARMELSSAVAVLSCLLLMAATDACETPADEDKAGGAVSGRLVDAEGNPRNVHAAAVFLIDAATGYPLLAESQRIMGLQNGLAGPDGWLHVVTDSSGHFTFPHVQPGRYRVAAQSWIGRAAVPTMKDDDSILAVHGSSTEFTVTDADVHGVEIVSAGAAVLTVQANPDEGNAYLFVSTAAPQAEPVLGPFFWGQDFVNGVVGVTHIKRGRQVIQGLPSTGRVHVMLLNYDNNAGVGGVSVQMAPVTAAELPIYATWSNGYYRPPERLRGLTEWVRSHPVRFRALLSDGDAVDSILRPSRDKWNAYIDWMTQHGHETRAVDDLGEYSVFDLVAAMNYLRILESHEARQARAGAQQQQPDGTPPDDVP